MSAPKPWMKFYPQDWRADEKLRMCSLAARGLWMEMLAIMHRSERYGQLLIGGHVPTDAQLAVQAGASPDEVSGLIGQLETAGVFSRAASGAIYSRRMTRDHKKAQTARKNGKNGGNPSLGNKRENTPLDKGEVKGQVKPTEARGQSSDTNVSGVPPPDPVKAMFDLGVSLLMAIGKTQKEARSLVGKWRNRFGDAEAMRLMLEAKSKTDPIAWIEGAGRTATNDLDVLIENAQRKYGTG